MNTNRNELIELINKKFYLMDQSELQELYDDINGRTDTPNLIPDWILLKESKKEIGQLKAEIDELNDKLEQKSCDLILNREARKEARKELLYKEITAQNSALQKRIRELKQLNNELICKLVKLEQEKA